MCENSELSQIIKKYVKVLILILLILCILSCSSIIGDNYCIPKFNNKSNENPNNNNLSLIVVFKKNFKLSVLEKYNELSVSGVYEDYKKDSFLFFPKYSLRYSSVHNEISIPYFSLVVNSSNEIVRSGYNYNDNVTEFALMNKKDEYAFMSKNDVKSIKSTADFFNNKEIIYKGTKFNTATVIPIYNKILEYNKFSDYSEYYKANKKQINFSDIEKYDKELYNQYNHRIDEEKKKLGYDDDDDVPIIQKYIKKYSNDYDLYNKKYSILWGWDVEKITDFDKADDDNYERYIFVPKSELMSYFYISNNPYGYDNNKIYYFNSLKPLQFLNENSALFLLQSNNSYDSMIYYMNEPNLAKRLKEIEYVVYDDVYEYTTTIGSKKIVPKFKEYKFPSINDEYKKEVKEIKELEERITKEFEPIINSKLQNIKQQQEILLAEINEMIKNYNETGNVEGVTKAKTEVLSNN